MKHPPQEPDVVPGGRILGIGIGVAVATIAGALIAYALGSCRARELEAEWPGPAMVPPAGDVNSIRTRPFDVEAQGLRDHASDEAWLRSYGWIDRAHGVAHIPLDTAARVYLERHTPGGRP